MRHFAVLRGVDEHVGRLKIRLLVHVTLFEITEVGRRYGDIALHLRRQFFKRLDGGARRHDLHFGCALQGSPPDAAQPNHLGLRVDVHHGKPTRALHRRLVNEAAVDDPSVNQALDFVPAFQV